MRYYTNILLGKNSVYGGPSCIRFRVVIMTTLDHAVEEGCRHILHEEEEGEGGRKGGRRREGDDGGGREEVEEELHVFMCAVKMARLVNLISHYVVDIS